MEIFAWIGLSQGRFKDLANSSDWIIEKVNIHIPKDLVNQACPRIFLETRGIPFSTLFYSMNTRWEGQNIKTKSLKVKIKTILFLLYLLRRKLGIVQYKLLKVTLKWDLNSNEINMFSITRHVIFSDDVNITQRERDYYSMNLSILNILSYSDWTCFEMLWRYSSCKPLNILDFSEVF